MSDQNNSAPTMASVPIEVLQRLQPAATQMGIDLPGLSRFAPTIRLGMSIRSLALELGNLLKLQNIFIKTSGLIVTVDPSTGEETPMTARRLPDWAEQFCEFVSSPTSRRSRNSLPVEDAAQILETDTFRSCLRPLAGVHQVRLPVCRGEWKTTEDGRLSPAKVEFLEDGYDSESQIFTTDLLPYPMDWTIDQALEFFLDVLGEMPWVRKESEDAAVQGPTALLQNRSWAVEVTAIVGTYCHALFPMGTLRPMIAIFANKPGTGKTRLAEAALAHVHGFVAATGAPKDEEKMDVKLETIAQSMQPWVIFDDIGGSLRSNSLNRFITETMHGGRRFHSNSEFFKVPNVSQVFVTANELPTSEDLDRRALIAELFLAEEVRGRKFKRVMTPRWLASPATRADFLAACCAFVRNWIHSETYGAMPLHPTPLETFDEWTAVMGGIVIAADVCDPLEAPDRVVGGSAQTDEIKQLLIVAASSQADDIRMTTLTRGQLVAFARTNGLLEELVGVEGDPDLDDTANKRFGKRMQRWRGQELTDTKGRRFQFSHKRKKSGATYPLAFLTKPTAP